MSERIWLTSDLHFCHDREFLYEPRGFKNIWEMNEAIVKNWNSVVDWDDDVYVLGDLMLNNDDEGLRLIKQLKGRIHVVFGNHCTDQRIEKYKSCYNIVEMGYAIRLRYHKFHFYLTHYPTLCSNSNDGKKLSQRVIGLCGHCHTSDPFADWDKGVIYHVELDAHNLYPVSIDEVIEDLRGKYNEEDN